MNEYKDASSLNPARKKKMGDPVSSSGTKLRGTSLDQMTPSIEKLRAPRQRLMQLLNQYNNNINNRTTTDDTTN